MSRSLRSRFARGRYAAAVGIVLGAAALPVQAQEQVTTLSGIVFGPGGQPVEHVQVLLDATVLAALTDAAGQFRVDGVTAGPHMLTFVKGGFQGKTYRFTLPDQLEPELDLGAILLEPVEESLTAVTGTVVDSISVEPVAAAQVKLGDMVVMSDAEGGFRVDGVKPGFQTVEVRRIGFQPTFVDFEIPLGQPRVSLIIKMSSLPVELAEVTVEGQEVYATGKLQEFYERLDRGFGHFITPADIEKRSARVPTDYLYGVPGLQVTPGPFGRNSVRLSRVTTGCSSPVVYVDGARVMGADLDNLLSVGDIQGIEVYTRASDIPAQYNTQGAGSCGLILVWTR